jgi:tetratricopeptide (TPR) repeat protein
MHTITANDLASGAQHAVIKTACPVSPGMSLQDVIALSPADLAKIPVGDLNLLCASGLRDTRDLDIGSCLRTLERWAGHVRQETDRHLYRFRQAPDEFNGSEGYFRILMLITVLQQDCGVRYDMECSKTSLFRHSGEGFIHGLLDGRGMGTCSSLPVLYVAIGRRLGYPLHLCLAKGHVFCRWEDERERFNIEASGSGLCTPTDDYYLKWPKAISSHELQVAPFLRNMSRLEELALFLSIRGHCLADSDRYAEAIEAFQAARRFAPDDPHYRAFLDDAVLRFSQQQSYFINAGRYDIFYADGRI